MRRFFLLFVCGIGAEFLIQKKQLEALEMETRNRMKHFAAELNQAKAQDASPETIDYLESKLRVFLNHCKQPFPRLIDCTRCWFSVRAGEGGADDPERIGYERK